jgi:hypothetical protein
MANPPRERGALILIGAVLVATVGVALLVVSSNTHRVGASDSRNPFSTFSPPPPSPTPSHMPPQSGRDPFGSPSTSPSPPPASPTPTPTSTPPGSPGGGSSISIGGHTVVLDDIFTVAGVTKVQVEVDGVVYTVALGQGFGGSFMLRSINGACAGFLFNSQAFSLCQTANK